MSNVAWRGKSWAGEAASEGSTMPKSLIDEIHAKFHKGSGSDGPAKKKAKRGPGPGPGP